MSKDNNTLISVIVPVFNASKHLSACLDNVLDQTLKNIEVICINDGSTDTSSKIIDTYSKKDNRVRVLNQRNQGSGPARNKGISIATGEFIAFLDADDLYPSEDTLEIMYEAATKYKVKITGGCFTEFEADSQRITTKWKYKYLDGYTFQENKLMKYDDYQFDYGYHRFIYSRTFLLENNIAFPSYKRFQDPPFMVKAFLCAKTFYALNVATYKYRKDGNEIVFNEDKTLGVLNGAIDNLDVALGNNLLQLAEYTLARVADHVYKFKEPISLDTYKKMFYILNLVEGMGIKNKKTRHLNFYLKDTITEAKSRYEQEINKLQNVIIGKNEVIQGLETKLLAQEEETRRIQGDLQRQQNNYEDIINSTSWKVTAPLRKVGGVIKHE